MSYVEGGKQYGCLSGEGRLMSGRPSLSLLTTSFPPKGGSGVQRPYFQAKYLQQAGWDVRVISIDDGATVSDPSFPDLTSTGLELLRLPTGVISFRQRIAKRLEQRLRRRFFFPDEYLAWSRRAVRCALRAGAERHVVMASVGSPSALLALREVKARDTSKQVVTIVDFRDFWALNQRHDVPDDRKGGPQEHRRSVLERAILETVDGVVVVSNEYRRRFLVAYPWFPESRVVVVENGFVEQDFAECERRLPTSSSNARFTIRYTGYLLEDHEPATFFEGLGLLKKNNPAAYSAIRFEYFGGGPAFAMRLAEHYDVSDVCVAEPYVPHSRAVELMLTADALYLPFAEGEGTIGGKTYEYIRSGRPLIATLLSCDEPRRLLERFGVRDLIQRGDSQAVAAMVERLVSCWREGMAQRRVGGESLPSIERSHQTAKLSDWLGGLTVR